MTETESFEELLPEPWWMRTLERAVTFVLILAFGTPVALAGYDVLVAAAVGAVGATVVNVAWWRLVRGVPLSDVYRALSPWV